MASFSLRSQRTGKYKNFSLLEILKLLGDQVNDEIHLENGEDVYNLSSFQEIGGNAGGDVGGSPVNWSVEAPAQVAGQSTFQLQYTPAAVLLVIFNGIIQARYQDFSLAGKAVSFPFLLGSQDKLQFIYQY